jgi:serine phosphatase RsbU (regulator of sigma subunit)
VTPRWATLWGAWFDLLDMADIRVLLIEDDEGDALLTRDWLAEADEPFDVCRVRTLAEAQPLIGAVDCVLLDLGLPDATGLDGIERLRVLAGRVAVVVLTGRDDERHGVAAVAAGAQDYLVKGTVSGTLLARTIRYAVQRRHSEEVEQALLEERLRAQENRRLERGLLPRPLLRDPRLSTASRYRPGGQRILLGGDFFDVVEDPSGALHAIIGDVAGHGPDEAALGGCLRIAWRTLILAGRPDTEVVPVLAQVLANERHNEVTFATVCTVTVAADRRSATLYRAGHPAPLIRTGVGWELLSADVGPAVGLLPAATWEATLIALPPAPWSVLLYTDGLIGGRVGDAGDRLGQDGLAVLATDVGMRLATGDPDGPDPLGRWRFGGPDPTAGDPDRPPRRPVPGRAAGPSGAVGFAGRSGAAGGTPAGDPDGALLDGLIAGATGRNGGPLADDVALLMINCR